MKGQVAQARSLTEQYTDFAELQQPGRVIGEVLVAHVAIAQGDFDTAVALLQRAAEVLEPTGAAKALSHAEARHGMKSALFAPELALARTWTRAAERDWEGAISAVREAARTAEGGGQSAVALQALHDAVRLGDPGDIDRIIRLAREGIAWPAGSRWPMVSRWPAAMPRRWRRWPPSSMTRACIRRPSMPPPRLSAEGGGRSGTTAASRPRR